MNDTPELTPEQIIAMNKVAFLNYVAGLRSRLRKTHIARREELNRVIKQARQELAAQLQDETEFLQAYIRKMEDERADVAHDE